MTSRTGKSLLSTAGSSVDVHTKEGYSSQAQALGEKREYHINANVQRRSMILQCQQLTRRVVALQAQVRDLQLKRAIDDGLRAEIRQKDLQLEVKALLLYSQKPVFTHVLFRVHTQDGWAVNV